MRLVYTPQSDTGGLSWNGLGRTLLGISKVYR